LSSNKFLDSDGWDSPGWKDTTREYHEARRPKAERPRIVVNNDLNDDSPLTEDAIALRFSEQYADTLRYVSTRGQWLQWSGNKWCPEKTSLAFDLVRQSCREDAKTFGNGNPSSTVYSRKVVAAVEFFARADRRQAATVEQFDAQDMLFNTGGTSGMIDATFDLISGIPVPPNPAHYITKSTACSAAPPGAPHPIWTAFLNRCVPDVETQKFLQRFFGYCATGSTIEHTFLFLYGTGANGKSTLVNTIREIFGDYATIADIGTFIASNQDRHPADLAKLVGARLAVAQETQKGRQWDEAKIKTMTGGDTMTARFMRQDWFDFTPKFKLLVTGNYKPRLESIDEAMRRRLLLVPFMVQIPPDERDPDLSDKLKAEWPALLRWILDGCGEWRRDGLKPPATVTEATKDYFDNQDLLQQWLDDSTEDGGPYAFTATADLYASWRAWCDARGIKPGSSNNLSEAIEDHGFERKRSGHSRARGFKRLCLKEGCKTGGA
jgi:putative DNA primase/helicase